MKVLLLTLIVSLAVPIVLLVPSRANANATVFSNGSFIQPNIALKWTVADWEQEMLTLKEVGNELLIIQWTADSTAANMYTYYPTDIPKFECRSNGRRGLSRKCTDGCRQCRNQNLAWIKPQ